MINTTEANATDERYLLKKIVSKIIAKQEISKLVVIKILKLKA